MTRYNANNKAKWHNVKCASRRWHELMILCAFSTIDYMQSDTILNVQALDNIDSAALHWKCDSLCINKCEKINLQMHSTRASTKGT